MIDDFDDVSDTEKVFLKLWNAFIRSSTYVADKDLPEQCMQFITVNASSIQGFEEHLICHLITLWEEHQLTRDHILVVMKHYAKTISTATVEKLPPVIVTEIVAVGEKD
jgi:hypothetical protein